MSMKETMQHLDEAFRLLSKIPVAGEAVDLMAMARQELRAAYRLLQEQAGKEAKTDG